MGITHMLCIRYTYQIICYYLLRAGVAGGERKEPWFLTSLALDSFIMYRSLALLASLHRLDFISGVTPFSSFCNREFKLRKTWQLCYIYRYSYTSLNEPCVLYR